MPIGAVEYDRDILPESHWQALTEANIILIDEVLSNLTDLSNGEAFPNLSLADFLPSRYLLRYDEQFLRRFLVCLVSVGLKLQLPGLHPLGCTAEELAVHAMKQLAGALLEEQGEEADFTDWDDVVFEDTDHEFLFDPALDGIEDTAAGEQMTLTNLKFDAWFIPFSPPRVMHPYAADEDIPDEHGNVM